MIDPPWPKRKGGRRAVRPDQSRELDYQTLSVPDIFTLLDEHILPTDRPHAVFLWCIDTSLLPAELAMETRGYRRHARFVWDKRNGVAPAFTVRYSHEYLVWFYKPTFAPIDRSQRGRFLTVFASPGREHSRKPDCAYAMVAALYPNAEKCDVFSREPRVGWQQWGNEVNRFQRSNDALESAEPR
jgi:N6-adenosine-specific RNA methylase IME4